jgi:hypothetical protein
MNSSEHGCEERPIPKPRHHPDGPSVLTNEEVKKIKKVQLSLGLIN